MKKEEIIKEIVDSILDFKMIPFIGAGMSKGFGASDWSTIIDVLKSELKTSTSNYLLVAQEYEEKFGRDKLIIQLKKHCKLNDVNSLTLENHMKLLSMNPPIIYTTNYDNAIEEAASFIRKDYKTVVNLKDIVELEHNARQIIKFHGDFTDKDSLVFTRKDYDNRLNISEHPLDILFRSHILGKSVLFLGYSFNDENIEYIFNKHSELYGIDNIPRSYIVSFEQDEDKEKELKNKNVITLVLSSLEEFSELIHEINSEVFNKSIKKQDRMLFAPSPNTILTNYELKNLKSFVFSNNHTNEEKYEKIRSTIEVKELSTEIEDELCLFIEEVINGDYDLDIKNAFFVSFQHINIRKPENIIKLCLAFIQLSEFSRFRFSMNNFNLDIIMVIEMNVMKLTNDSTENKKWNCRIILGYLEAKQSESAKLGYEQVDRLLDALNSFGYNELDDIGCGFTPDNIESIINYHLSFHGKSLKDRFLYGATRKRTKRSFSDTYNSMIDRMPKDLLD